MTRNLAATLAAALLAAGCSLTLDTAQYEPKQAGDCAAGTKPCGYKCVRDDDPATGCGSPTCAPCLGSGGVNQQAACNPDGTCGLGCTPGFANCSGIPTTGCETSLALASSCGACGRSCGVAICLAPDLVCAPRVAPLGIVGTVTGLSVDTSTPGRAAYVAGATLNNGNMEGLLAGVAPTGYSMSLLSTPGGTLDPLYGLQFSNGTGYVLASPALAGSIPYLARITTLSPTVLSTVQSASGAGLPLGLAAGSGGSWWIHSAASASPICYTDEISTYQCASVGNPAKTPVAIAAAPWLANAKAYVADAAGVISSFAEPLNPLDVGTPIVLGAGRVGAMGARPNGLATELYWTDLDTGDVRFWSTTDPLNVGTIFKGSGPASKMGIAASSAGIYWTNGSTGEVMKFVPGTGAVRLGRSPSPELIAVDAAAWVYWTGADGTVYSTVW